MKFVFLFLPFFLNNRVVSYIELGISVRKFGNENEVTACRKWMTHGVSSSLSLSLSPPLSSKVVDKKCNEDHFETEEKVHGYSLERGMHKTVASTQSRPVRMITSREIKAESPR